MRRDAFGHGPGVDTCLARGCLNSREIEMEMPASQTGVCETFQLEIMGKKAVKHPRWKLTWGGMQCVCWGKKESRSTPYSPCQKVPLSLHLRLLHALMDVATHHWGRPKSREEGPGEQCTSTPTEHLAVGHAATHSGQQEHTTGGGLGNPPMSWVHAMHRHTARNRLLK